MGAEPAGRDTVSFLSDFGLVDEFVGVVHRVIHSLAPQVTVIDVTHQIPPQDVRAGALALWRAAGWLAPGVVLAVVDPEVGTDRRAVAVEVAGGELVLVGPDNGLLTPAAYRAGPLTRAVALTDPRWHGQRGRSAVGVTFDGRDVFAPVVAHLCRGVDLGELGEAIPPARLIGGPLVLADAPDDVISEHGLDVEVLWVDTYGNVELGVAPATIDRLGPAVRVNPRPRRTPAWSHEWVAVRARGYAELGIGQLGLVPDSADLLALCLDHASAAAHLGLAAGDTIHLARVDRPPPDPPAAPRAAR